MPEDSEKEVIRQAHEDEREGKSASTQAGEFVREEMHHIREGKHGARSPQQAIAIGLSKARRAGVKLPPPKQGKASAKVRHQAERDLSEAAHPHKPSPTRSRATSAALRREGHSAASHDALSQQTRSAARRRGPQSRRRAAISAVRTKGPAGMRKAARKGARTRARHER
jgi:hypothetical protein